MWQPFPSSLSMQSPNEVPFSLLGSLSDNGHLSTGSLTVLFRLGLAYIRSHFPHTYYLPLLVFFLGLLSNPKHGRNMTLCQLHDITTQKTTLFILNIFCVCVWAASYIKLYSIMEYQENSNSQNRDDRGRTTQFKQDISGDSNITEHGRQPYNRMQIHVATLFAIPVSHMSV
jgi:hypothetical protein